MTRLIPRYKLMMTYNVLRNSHDEYYQFVVQDMVPSMQAIGLHMYRVYHTAYGNRPLRQIEFLAEDLETVQNALSSAAWKRIESKLLRYITDYTRKVVVFREGFQL